MSIRPRRQKLAATQHRPKRSIQPLVKNINAGRKNHGISSCASEIGDRLPRGLHLRLSPQPPHFGGNGMTTMITRIGLHIFYNRRLTESAGHRRRHSFGDLRLGMSGQIRPTVA